MKALELGDAFQHSAPARAQSIAFSAEKGNEKINYDEFWTEKQSGETRYKSILVLSNCKQNLDGINVLLLHLFRSAKQGKLRQALHKRLLLSVQLK